MWPLPPPPLPLQGAPGFWGKAGRGAEGRRESGPALLACGEFSHGWCLEKSAVATWGPSTEKTGEGWSLKSGDIQMGSSDVFPGRLAFVEAEGYGGDRTHPPDLI